MGKLSEIRDLIKEAEHTNNKTAHECLLALLCLSTSDMIDTEMYDIILERIIKQTRLKK